jgi:hypothetical protein
LHDLINDAAQAVLMGIGCLHDLLDFERGR